MAKKRNWKYWSLRVFLFLIILGGIWVVNLIWLKPFNIRHFYDRVFIEFALNNPETVTALGVPLLYDWTKDELTDVSDETQWKEFNDMKDNYEVLMSYDFESQSKENQLKPFD